MLPASENKRSEPTDVTRFVPMYLSRLGHAFFLLKKLAPETLEEYGELGFGRVLSPRLFQFPTVQPEPRFTSQVAAGKWVGSLPSS